MATKSCAQPIPLLTREARIKRRLRAHLRELGFRVRSGTLIPPDTSKSIIRELHALQRADRLKAEADFVKKNWPPLKKYFANGNEINPEAIAPRLELISAETWQSDLFRLATLTWSIPVSQGYGRRMRYLVWDAGNDKLIGLIALGDPVFNLRVRDSAISWTGAQRQELLVNTMDAYVLGAVAPYNSLLGGKLVAALIKSRGVHQDFHKRYNATSGIISGRDKHASLVLVTTSSALGRSSVYNRLRLPGYSIFDSVGYTAGWGHFHIPEDLFEDIRSYLSARGDAYAANHRYGSGPNWRLRTIRKGLSALGVDPHVLKHGIGREVLLCTLASNGIAFLAGKALTPDFSGLLETDEVGRLAIARWVLPRAARDMTFRNWRNEDVTGLLSNASAVPSATAAVSIRQESSA